MERSNRCSYCDKEERDLLIPTCKHNFCEKCFIKICLFNQNEILFSLKENVKQKCILCNSGEINVSKKEILKILISSEKTNKPLFHQCQIHKKDENVYCKECRVAMCPKCLEEHQKVRAFQKHQEGPMPLQINEHCPNHEKLLDYQCLQCEVPICEICKSTDHKNHKLEFIKQFYENKKNEVVNQFNLPYNNYNDFNKTIESQQIQIKLTVQNKFNTILEEVQKMIDSLNKTKNEIILKSKEIETQIDSNYEITKIIYKSLYIQLENLTNEDYFNIHIFSKLPKNYHIPQFMEEVDVNYMKRLKMLQEMVERLNDNDYLKLNCRRLINFDNLSNVQTITSHSNSVRAAIQLKCGKLVTCSNDQTIKIFDVENNFNCIKTLNEHTAPVFCVIQMECGKLASGSGDNSIKIWNSRKDFKCVKTLIGHTDYVRSIIELEEGLLVSGSRDDSIKIWKDFECIKTLNEHSRDVTCLVSLDEGKFASGSDDKLIKIFDCNKNFELVKTLSGHKGHVQCLFKLKDGVLASGSSDKTIKLWNPKNNFCLFKTMNGHAFHIYSIIQLSNGNLASSSSDKTIKIWNEKQDYKCCATLIGNMEDVYCLVQLKNGVLVSGARDNSIRIWN